MWRSHRVLILRPYYLHGRRRTNSFINLSNWSMNLKDFFTHLMQWLLYNIKLILIDPFAMSYKSVFIYFFNIFLSLLVKMSWKIGDRRSLFLKLKSKLGLCHDEFTPLKLSSAKLPLTVVEKQQLPDIKKTDSKEEFSFLKWTIHNDSRRVCANFKTDRDQLEIVMYRYR